MAAGDGSGAAARHAPAPPRRSTRAQDNAARTAPAVTSATLILANMTILLFESMTGFQDRSTTRTPALPARIADGRKPNEQSVLDDAWDGGQPRRQRLRIGDPLQRAIENPVPAIRDESVAVLGPPQRRGRGRAGVGIGRFDRASRRLQAERLDFDRQREAAERGTHFDSSAMTIMRADAAATIFSRSNAPPPPLIRLRSGAISSAPSTVRSSSGVSSNVDSGTPTRSASRRVASEVGTPMTLRPARTRSPSSSTKCLAVEPVPRPSRMPGRTNSIARAAAARFCASGFH